MYNPARPLALRKASSLCGSSSTRTLLIPSVSTLLIYSGPSAVTTGVVVRVLVAFLVALALGSAFLLWLRLRRLNHTLTTRLADSSLRFNPPRSHEIDSRLETGLKLLETVIAPREVIVFQLDGSGELVCVARSRASSNESGELPATDRNSAWRHNISLCERAVRTGEVIAQELNHNEPSTGVALPLRHENRVVGALLMRLGEKFDEADRTLLSAVGGQLARDLQREAALKEAFPSRRRLSPRSLRRQLELVDVLNGVLLEQRFGVSALAEITDGIAIAYLDGTLAYINSSFLRLVNLTHEQARKFNLFDLLDALRGGVFDEPAIAVRRVLQTGLPYEQELQLADGTQTFQLRISLVKDSGPAGDEPQPLCLGVTVRDLTTIKEHEQLKSDMISLMSHELRTPLTSINGFSELLMADDELPESAREFVSIIANESQRLSRMINTFLAVAQLERKDRQEFLRIPLRLDEVVRETITNLQPVAKRKRIRLVEQPCQRIPPVAADKSLISQAVTNLVSNAIKYSPERTTVTVATALEAEAVRVSVEDRGYGIPPEAVDRVWEKFYRVIREGQEKDEESTGLGLSFVREVVEQHGGTVDLETEQGRGSKFSFTLPRL